MKADESKAKYDWSNVPKEVQWIATDEDGRAFGWSGEPKPFELIWNSHCHRALGSGYGGVTLSPEENPYKGDWRDSLEQRPHPCATCPNVGHKACCCEVTA